MKLIKKYIYCRYYLNLSVNCRNTDTTQILLNTYTTQIILLLEYFSWFCFHKYMKETWKKNAKWYSVSSAHKVYCFISREVMFLCHNKIMSPHWSYLFLTVQTRGCTLLKKYSFVLQNHDTYRKLSWMSGLSTLSHWKWWHIKKVILKNLTFVVLLLTFNSPHRS